MVKVAIIPARGGSKGIPKKNIIPFCGKPLIAWTIEQCIRAEHIDEVWVTSDCEEILDIAVSFGASVIRRPAEFSGDAATSESAWLHALEQLESMGKSIELVIAPQLTSPLREPEDLDQAIELFQQQQLDSLFSASPTEDMFIWERNNVGELTAVNYDPNSRRRRQDISPQFVENGSFYLFKPEILKGCNNRLGGVVGLSLMEFWKMFEIDTVDDIRMCKALMREYLLGEQYE